MMASIIGNQEYNPYFYITQTLRKWPCYQVFGRILQKLELPFTTRNNSHCMITLQNNFAVSPKVKIDLQFWPSNSPDYLPKKKKILSTWSLELLMFLAALVIIVQTVTWTDLNDKEILIQPWSSDQQYKGRND
jgi:hypothetical protein